MRGPEQQGSRPGFVDVDRLAGGRRFALGGVAGRIASGLALLVGVAGCSESVPRSERPAASHTINVVATTGMIGELAARIGGRHVHVHSLMGPGVDPHLYKASEGDVQRMADADLIFYNGLHLEGAMAELFERMKERIPTFAVTDGIERALLLAPSEFAGNYDPHVWFDVRLWTHAAAHVCSAFVRHDPAHGEDYRRHGRRYVEELDSLDAEIRRRVQALAPDRRILVTAHDAFHYFGRAYGFEVRGLQGISTAAEAGTADVQRLADFIATRRIPAIFVETSVPVRSIEAVQAAVRSRGYHVRIGGHLYSDALGRPDSPEGSYAGMVRYNVATIVEALKEAS